MLSDACGPVGHPNLVSPEPDRREPESGFIIIEWEKVEGGVEDRAMIRRPRIVHKATFEERLAEEARQFKEAAEKQPPGSTARELLLRRARQAETASRMNDWLSSPGLASPK